MKAAAPSCWQPRRGIWLGLGAMLFLASAPHLLRLHPLAAAGWLGIVGWRLYGGLHQQAPPGKLIRLLLLGLAAATLLLQFGTLLGREAGSALLVMMLALKFLELKGPRDVTVLVYLGYFLLAIQLLFSQSIPTALYLAVTALLITTLWIEFSDGIGGRSLRPSLRLAGVMLLQSMPLMLVLFLLFPRIPGPLWSLPRDAHSGVTGLSNEMEPGHISQLANSEAVAFRVEFTGPIPPAPQRYWRGPVFEVTDGRRWLPARREGPPPVFTPEPLGTGIRQTITLEPHGKRSLLALDLPGSSIPGARLQTDFQLLAREPVRERIRYEVTSYSTLDSGAIDADTRQRSLFVPQHTSARVRALAQQWREQAGQPLQIIEQALQHFHQQPFVYTLTPPRLEQDPVDQFLFETRRGFCEHYAAAFTLLMRAAGLPARVVTGYLGGEVNPVGNYLIVRQSDAHAWSEVWLPDRGWVRVDPTAAVAPERIERAIDLAPTRDGAAVQFRLADVQRMQLGLQQLRLYWDAVNNGWNQWVLGYGPALQQSFLKDLGLPDVSWRGIVQALAVTVMMVMTLLGALLLRRPRPRQEPVQQLYLQFCQRLEKAGVVRRHGEGPQDFARRAARLRPEWAQPIQAVSEHYIALRYGRARETDRLPRLVQALQALR